MARGSTVLHFTIELSDVDRGVYESLTLTPAQHPSESGAYLVARVLAHALEQTDGLTFTRGLSEADEPALWVKDLTGRLRTWIEIGTPDASRLHKASKAADSVVVYVHRDPTPWLRNLAKERVHAADTIRLVALPPRELEALAQGVGRRNAWSVSRVEGTVYVEADGASHALAVEELEWPEG